MIIKLLQPLSRIRCLQQRSIPVLFRTSQQTPDGCAQINHQPSRSQILAVTGVKDRTTPCCQNNTLALRQVIDHRLFPFTESLLTLNIEYPRYIGPGTPLNLVITVEKLTSQAAGKLSPDRCFAISPIRKILRLFMFEDLQNNPLKASATETRSYPGQCHPLIATT